MMTVVNSASAPGGAAFIQTMWSRGVDYDRRHPTAIDALAALAWMAVSVPWMILHTAHGAMEWTFQVALVLPLIWRRRNPLAVFYALGAVALVQWFVSVPLLADGSLLVALFTVALYLPVRTALVAAAGLLVGVVLASVRWSLTDSWLTSVVGLTGLVAAAVLAGAALQIRQAHLVQLTERAARLELERDQQARIAVAAERTRIAREMHDVIAHSLAVIVTLADGAAAKLPRNPDRAAVAIRSIAQVGRDALGDTRRLLGVLREQQSSAEMSPQPGLDQLEGLINQLNATGLEATLTVSGHPFPLAPAAELTVYRLLQEAATNTLKHAQGTTRFEARLTYACPVVRVDASDDGRPAPARPELERSPSGRSDPGGHGIVGMRERVALYGGTLVSGPRPEGGWQVSATLIDPARNAH